jgi:hypothetical protein
MKDRHNGNTSLIGRLGFFCLEPDGGVGAGVALGMGSLILIPLEDFPMTFLSFFQGVRLAAAFLFTGLSLQSSGTSSN